MTRFIQIRQLYSNGKNFQSQSAGVAEIEPSNILYIEEYRVKNNDYKVFDNQPPYNKIPRTQGNFSKNPLFFRYSIVHTITGQKILSDLEPEKIREMIDEFYAKQEEDNRDKITITKADLVKNFIFKNLTGT